jgi:hypothetical protein
MNRLLYIILIVCSALQLFGQQDRSVRKGQISFISSQNIYVNFKNTENLHKGDTLFISRDNKLIPVLIVDQLSSISCICKAIGQTDLKVSNEIVAHPWESKVVNQKEAPVVNDTTNINTGIKTIVPVSVKAVTSTEQLVQGRLSLSSYSNFSDVSGISNTRLRYTLQLNAGSLKKSGLSAESYIQYTQNTNGLPQSTNSIFNQLKIYNLCVKYKMNDGINFTVGRSMNTKVSNLGSIDGLQMEINPSNFFIGAMAGYRPDYLDYGFNSNLFEYGAYFGHHYHSDNGIVQSTIAFFNQNNQGKTDRRFAYFQHDNALVKDLNLFISGEVDLFKIQNGKPMNTLNLTSLYVSLSLRVNKQLSLFGSYDERKNVIYYQTFKNRGDSIFEAATRQGVQFRINYRPGKLVYLGLNTGYQFRDKDIRSTENVSGYLSFNQIPGINATATMSSNLLRTGYLDGKIFGLRINRDIISGKISTGLGYQYIDYQFSNSNPNLIEHIGNLDFFWRITRKLSFSVYGEKTFEKPVSYTRVYANLIIRF